jgi:predicted ribosomally synthesized six-cysteine peptide SCIFF
MKKNIRGFFANVRREPQRRHFPMKHVKTLSGANLTASVENGGCGECQTSCQSACKTSCTVANQKCEKGKRGR